MCNRRSSEQVLYIVVFVPWCRSPEAFPNPRLPNRIFNMFSARLIFYVAVIFAGYLSVNAAPVDPKDIQAGRVFRTEPQHFTHQSGGSHQGQRVAHPVVSTSNAYGGYANVVATTSSFPYFPADMRDHVVPAADYTQHTDKQFSTQTYMAVGNPQDVHVDHLRRVGENAQIPHQLHRTDTEKLMRDVYGHGYSGVAAEESPYNAYRAAHDAATHAGYQPPHNPNAQHQYPPQQHGQHPAPHPQQQHPYGYQPQGQQQHSQHPQQHHQHPAPHPQQQHQYGYQPQGQQPQRQYSQHPQGQYPYSGFPPPPHGGYPPHRG
ncbi:hypothetical protein F5887DRAFT_1285932 [Amanita rubescens]|nr:hypothetical protein F5887DRAFT_1285932 [Amanita rubescens]